MRDFRFTLKTEILFGKTALRNLGELTVKLGRKGLILYGSNRIEKDGLLKEIESLLKEEGIDTIRLSGIRENPDVKFAQEAAEMCKRESIQFILAVGGGSVMDTAKAVAIGACSKQDIWTTYSEGLQNQEALPIGVVVTLPATASESNGTSVISNYKTHEKKVLFCKDTIPRFAIMNPEYTLTLPASSTAVAAIDIFSHCFERYFDLRYKSLLRRELCASVMRVIISITPEILKSPMNYELRSEFMWAADIAHNDILGVGGDFACHGLSHALTVQFGISHGAALAIIMPAWCRYMVKKSREPFCKFANDVWQKAEAEEGIEALQEFERKLGLAVTLKEVVTKNVNIEELIEKTFSNERANLGGGFDVIGAEDAREIFNLAIGR